VPTRGVVMFDAMDRRFEDTMARARARTAALDRAADELAGVRGRASSPGGEAEAVVDGRGGLASLWLAESVGRRPPAEIGALIVDTAQAAALDAMRRRQEAIADLVADLGR
jgi:hypothetical protein